MSNEGATVRRANRQKTAFAVLALTVAAAGGYLALWQSADWSASRQVRAAVAARRFDAAEKPLERWLRASPRSAEAQYYLARLKLAANQPDDALLAINRALARGFDRAPLDCLTAIIQSRAGHYTEAEPILLQAFQQGMEPQVEIAQELARVYLSTYRFPGAAAPLERWRELAPSDATPYLWRNELESRKSTIDPATIIENYMEALKRDPTLNKARLGLAERLRQEHRLEDARREFATYLAGHANDVEALDGAGQAALEAEDIAAAVGLFEAAVAADPKNTTALKELAQINLRRGRFQDACKQLSRVAEIDRFDPDIHYTYARALKLSGDDARARAETELSMRLRNEHNDLEEIRSKLLKNPDDVEIRFQIARWFLDHGRDEEGLNWSREILRQAPHHQSTHRLLAAYYDRKGNAGLSNYHRTMAEAAQAEGPSKSASTGSAAPR
jgi:predicted Zn-dependent protease